MKKIAILLVFVFAAAMITSCKSSKGCGLTGSVQVESVSDLAKA